MVDSFEISFSRRFKASVASVVDSSLADDGVGVVTGGRRHPQPFRLGVAVGSPIGGLALGNRN